METTIDRYFIDGFGDEQFHSAGMARINLPYDPLGEPEDSLS
jgi:hypothetical protein